MKRFFLISAIFAASTCFAQNQGGYSNALFQFDNAGMPKEIHRLGTSPEFPFLRNKSSARQLAMAIKKNDEKSTAGMTELNDMLMAIGFTNGAKDVDASNITMYYMPPGTTGNMGSGNYSVTYCRLEGDASEFKAWKIASSTGGNMYILAKCGNAFFPQNQNKTACLTVPVSLTGDMKEVTLNSDGQKTTTTDKVYVYYHMKHHRKHAHPMAEISDPYPSRAILLRNTDDVEVVPETYKVTVNSPDNTVMVCPDSTLNLTANINVEKTSTYSGYYPDKSKNEYKQVSKRTYKRIARKMRRVDRKEHKVDSLSGVTVNV